MVATSADSVVRDVKEGTGFDIEVTGIVGTYTDPRHIIAYTDGELAISSESTEIRFVDPSDLPSL